MWQPAQRYPDPAIEILDESFERCVARLAAVERLAEGCRFCEGPVWFGDGRFLLWSDIPNNRILRWDETNGAVSIYRQPSGYANGNTRDRQGRLITCEHGTRRVTRTEYDGSLTVLADSYEGRHLNSPNDVVVTSDDAVWFTDPPFGIRSDYEGGRAEQELPDTVYRIDPKSGAIQAVITELKGPNGLAFSPDERTLYIVEGRNRPNRLIVAYDIACDWSLGRRRIFIDAGSGTPDGFRVDELGNLWCGWGMGSDELDGVMVFNPQGRPIGRIALPERCANVCFGGLARNRLFMVASQSLYALFTCTRGL